MAEDGVASAEAGRMPRVKIDGWECTRCGHVGLARGREAEGLCPLQVRPLGRAPRSETADDPQPKPWERRAADD